MIIGVCIYVGWLVLAFLCMCTLGAFLVHLVRRAIATPDTADRAVAKQIKDESLKQARGGRGLSHLTRPLEFGLRGCEGVLLPPEWRAHRSRSMR